MSRQQVAAGVPRCMEEREGLILAWERRLEFLAHDVQRTEATGRPALSIPQIITRLSSGPRYPWYSSSSLPDLYGSCSKYSSKNDGRKVAYHGMPCLWEHENALQRSQDPNKNKRCNDRRKRRWKKVVEKPPLWVSQICAYARSIEARVSQICAYARDRVKAEPVLQKNITSHILLIFSLHLL